jgi:hypothetical protein
MLTKISFSIEAGLLIRKKVRRELHRSVDNFINIGIPAYVKEDTLLLSSKFTFKAMDIPQNREKEVIVWINKIKDFCGEVDEI